MTDASSRSGTPRRSADPEYRLAARPSRAVEPEETRGRRAAAPEPEPPRRGARRFAEPEPEPAPEATQVFRPAFATSDYADDSPRPAPWPQLRTTPEPTPWPQPKVKAPPKPEPYQRPEPEVEPLSSVWAAAAARNQAALQQDDPPVPETAFFAPEPSVWDVPKSEEPVEAETATPESKQKESGHGVKPATTPDEDDDDEVDEPRGTRWLMVVAIILVVVGLGVGTWVVAKLGWGFGDAPPQPSATSPDPESTVGATPVVGELVLNDTDLTSPDGWNLYGDELIQEDRRVIRLVHAETDLRLQVSSLVSTDMDLQASCEALSTNQQELYSDVTVSPTLSVGVDPAQGAGVACGFHGTRNSDGMVAAVSFTVLMRASDAHVLTLRSIIPDDVTAGATARQELAAMNCTASLNFGVTLPLC